MTTPGMGADDPNHPATLARQLRALSAQAAADTQYDVPPFPRGVAPAQRPEAFVGWAPASSSRSRSRSSALSTAVAALGAAAALAALLLATRCGSGSGKRRR